MNRLFSILLLGLLACVSCASGTPFEQANQRFAAGDFAGAAESYEKLLADEGPDAAAYYNLGNSYQSMKRYGPAILAYERARLLTPRDPDLLANLALARKAAAAFEESGGNLRLDALARHLSLNEWSWMVVVGALGLGVLSVLCGSVKIGSRRGRFLAGVFGAFAGVAIILGAAALYVVRADGGRGIVLTENAAVRLSPFEKAESLGTAGPGRLVRLGESNGGFRYIEVPGTVLHGWLSQADVAAIAPESPGK